LDSPGDRIETGIEPQRHEDTKGIEALKRRKELGVRLCDLVTWWLGGEFLGGRDADTDLTGSG
jgi:hypothetical protein